MGMSEVNKPVASKTTALESFDMVARSNTIIIGSKLFR